MVNIIYLFIILYNLRQPNKYCEFQYSELVFIGLPKI